MTTTHPARRRRALALAMFVAFLPSGVALAAPPLTIPPEPVAIEFEIPAGTACDFGLDVGVNGKTGAIIFDDGRVIWTSPGLSLTFGRQGSSATFTANATGTFHDQPGVELEDGSFRVRTHAVGHNVLFGPFEADGQTDYGARLYVGRVSLTITYDVDGVATFSDVDASAAQVIDICHELS